MPFTPNDYAVATLTQAGADALNAKGVVLNEAFPKSPVRWRTDYAEGEKIRRQFWCIMGDFEEFWRAGAAMPFSDLRLVREDGPKTTPQVLDSKAD